MPRASMATSSGYLVALTQEIEKKLQRALASQSQRLNLLQELFADIALEVDGRARDIIRTRGDDGVSPEEGGIQNQLCFYDVLADHYIRVPDSGTPILDLIVQLWSQSFASNIFALLFHKWNAVCEGFAASIFEAFHDNAAVGVSNQRIFYHITFFAGIKGWKITFAGFARLKKSTCRS